MRHVFASSLALLGAAVFCAGSAAWAHEGSVSPLLGVWKGDVVRIHDGAVIGRNILTLRIGSARVGSTFAAELPLPPACTAQFRIAARVNDTTRIVGIPRALGGDGRQCVLAQFWDGYAKNAFKLVLLDNRRLRLTGLSNDVRVQATLFRQK